MDEESHGKCEEDSGGELGVSGELEERAGLIMAERLEIYQDLRKLHLWQGLLVVITLIFNQSDSRLESSILPNS